MSHRPFKLYKYKFSSCSHSSIHWLVATLNWLVSSIFLTIVFLFLTTEPPSPADEFRKLTEFWCWCHFLDPCNEQLVQFQPDAMPGGVEHHRFSLPHTTELQVPSGVHYKHYSKPHFNQWPSELLAVLPGEHQRHDVNHGDVWVWHGENTEDFWNNHSVWCDASRAALDYWGFTERGRAEDRRFAPRSDRSWQDNSVSLRALRAGCHGAGSQGYGSSHHDPAWIGSHSKYNELHGHGWKEYHFRPVFVKVSFTFFFFLPLGNAYCIARKIIFFSLYGLAVMILTLPHKHVCSSTSSCFFTSGQVMKF